MELTFNEMKREMGGGGFWVGWGAVRNYILSMLSLRCLLNIKMEIFEMTVGYMNLKFGRES